MVLSVTDLYDIIDEQQGTSTPLFNLQPNPQGRCAMIKHLALRFGHNDGGVFASSAAYYVPKQHHEGPSWAKFIHNVGYERGSEEICFTALDTLQLDFGYWEIGAVGRDRLLWVSSLSFLVFLWEVASGFYTYAFENFG